MGNALEALQQQQKDGKLKDCKPEQPPGEGKPVRLTPEQEGKSEGSPKPRPEDGNPLRLIEQSEGHPDYEDRDEDEARPEESSRGESGGLLGTFPYQPCLQRFVLVLADFALPIRSFKGV